MAQWPLDVFHIGAVFDHRLDFMFNVDESSIIITLNSICNILDEIMVLIDLGGLVFSSGIGTRKGYLALQDTDLLRQITILLAYLF